LRPKTGSVAATRRPRRIQLGASPVGRRGTTGLRSRVASNIANRTIALVVGLVCTVSAGAQQQDSAKAGGSRPAQSSHRAPHVDTAKGPPIPPGRAFLYSMLVPGLGQAKLDRAWTGALFAGIEVFAISRWQQAARDLRYAQTHRRDSIALYD